jgi:multimeric flavodoxin WrbA
MDKNKYPWYKTAKGPMMNILVINGSPKGEKSNTLKLTNAFIDGIHNAGNHPVEVITVSQKNIEPCRGCFCCWQKAPGECVIADDMAGILEKYINADVIIWSFPLYYYSAPSKTKALIDRLLPTNLPDIIARADGSAGHPGRGGIYKTGRFFTGYAGKFSRTLLPARSVYGTGQSKLGKGRRAGNKRRGLPAPAADGGIV